MERKIEFVRIHTPSLIKKCHNVSKVKAVVREADKILIIIDKENAEKYDENREVWRHLKKLTEPDKKKIVVIATEPCIEEWLCISLGFNFDRSGNDAKRKPDKVLEENRKYKKRDLPKFVPELNFEKLIKESNSFRAFYSELCE